MNSATDKPTNGLGTRANPLRVAIVGSGPSGFYTAEALLKLPLVVEVDMIDRLPVPFGLVRYGVAPDHPKLKQPTAVFDKIAQSPGFRFFGNVTVGRDLAIEELRTTHHAIVIACGAESDRRLGIPGEDLPGSHAATEFVGWYNGHPDYRNSQFDLSSEIAVVIGQGNVAIDIARVLCKPIEELRSTDMAAHALDALAKSRIREVHIIGRRGPAQAKFTNKELRELGDIAGCTCEVAAGDIQLNEACRQELEDKSNFVAAKNVEVLNKWVQSNPAKSRRRIVFHFLETPIQLEGNARVERIVLQRNELRGSAFAQQARGIGQKSAISCGLVFRSIGYLGRALSGLPFDAYRGVIPNQAGRIDGVDGIYAVGWIKRGPSGIIGTNRADAVATVQTMLNDLGCLNALPRTGARGLSDILAPRAIRVTDYTTWQRLDAEERRRGALSGKPREKVCDVQEMISLGELSP